MSSPWFALAAPTLAWRFAGSVDTYYVWDSWHYNAVLVPIAAWWGQGRKAGWWSPFLLAVYDEETGVYTAVTKCLSGFTE